MSVSKVKIKKTPLVPMLHLEEPGAFVPVSNESVDEFGTVPAGGTTNQVLKKNSDNDFDVKWAADESGHGIPDGGEYGQVLAKASDDDYDVEWVTPESGEDFKRGVLMWRVIEYLAANKDPVTISNTITVDKTTKVGTTQFSTGSSSYGGPLPNAIYADDYQEASQFTIYNLLRESDGYLDNGVAVKFTMTETGNQQRLFSKSFFLPRDYMIQLLFDNTTAAQYGSSVAYPALVNERFTVGGVEYVATVWVTRDGDKTVSIYDNETDETLIKTIKTCELRFNVLVQAIGTMTDDISIKADAIVGICGEI